MADLKFSDLNHTKRERCGLLLCCRPKPSRVWAGTGRDREGRGPGISILQEDHNHFFWSSPPPPTKPLLDGQHLDSFLSQPVCLEMRDEKRDRGTERDRIRGQKQSDGGREQGKGKAPEGPWSGAGCPLFWPRGKELHRAGSYTLPRWYFNFLGARPSLPVPAGSSGCVSKGCCACHVTVSSGRWLLI